MIKLKYDTSNREIFPYASISLLVIFYIIGIITYDGYSLFEFGYSYVSKDIIDRDIRSALALYPVYELQWTLFTYNLIHFAIVHYGYSGFLLFYYGSALERATNKKTIILGYYICAVVWPVIGGVVFFATVHFLPEFNIYLQSYTFLNFLGSSVGIWGLIGIATTSQYRRKFFWLPVVVLLFLEITLKIIVGRVDLATNILHILVFFGMWLFAWLFIDIENNDGEVGGFRFDRKTDYYLMGFALIHAVIMAWHMIYVFSIA
jgi:membrane associated rhomboid family serine protease